MSGKRRADEKSGLLEPYWSNGFSRGVILLLIPAITMCVIARAPQLKLDSISDWKLPISLDAISLTLIAPLFFLTISWLLFRLAHRQTPGGKRWEKSEVRVVAGLTALLGTTAIFMLVQFFYALAPIGMCDTRPNFSTLWSLEASQVNHCFSTASEINKTAWYYMEPPFLQAWLNIGFVALTVSLLWRAWNIWKAKFA